MKTPPELSRLGEIPKGLTEDEDVFPSPVAGKHKWLQLSRLLEPGSLLAGGGAMQGWRKPALGDGSHSRQLSELQLEVCSREKEKQGPLKSGWAWVDPSNPIHVCKKEPKTRSSFCHGFKALQNFFKNYLILRKRT